jgi:choline dehydrogenase
MPISHLGFSSGIISPFSAWVTSEIKPEDAARSSSQASYLKQALTTTDITVYTHTQAKNILFDEKKKATGVLVSAQGFEYYISANKEVIVSAGVFHSPQLLMVSVGFSVSKVPSCFEPTFADKRTGIGPKAILQSYGIPVISDLPAVGQNFWDQIFFDVLSGVSTPSTGDLVGNLALQPQLLQEYTQGAKGTYSSPSGFIAFEKIPGPYRKNVAQQTATLLPTLPSDWPEAEYIALAFPDRKGGTVGAFSATIEAPFSRRNVTFSSADITDPTIINMAWLTDPTDCELMAAIFKRCR